VAAAVGTVRHHEKLALLLEADPLRPPAEAHLGMWSFLSSSSHNTLLARNYCPVRLLTADRVAEMARMRSCRRSPPVCCSLPHRVGRPAKLVQTSFPASPYTWPPQLGSFSSTAKPDQCSSGQHTSGTGTGVPVLPSLIRRLIKVTDREERCCHLVHASGCLLPSAAVI
jgi:hypothetical protein